jgi:Leucine-rich repeat (LRR) protein
MKKFLFLLILLTGLMSNAQTVNIPDTIFKNHLLGDSSINTNYDDEISLEEAQAFTGTINVVNLGISDLTGIEKFVNITQLDCNNNKLTSLNVSKNTKLINLWCSDNKLTSLDVSKNIFLKELNCSKNKLTSLDVSQNTNLTLLYFYKNQISYLDITQNTSLIYLLCNNNQLSSLDVSKNTDLIALNVNDNLLTSLDINKNVNLQGLYCDNNQLISLDVSKNIYLKELYCITNQLTALDVSKNTSLVELYCNNNKITGLDVSKNKYLKVLNWVNNKLTLLNLKNGNNNSANPKSFSTVLTHNNPDLTCIQVDNVQVVNSALYLQPNNFTLDSTATFSETCVYPDIFDITNTNDSTINGTVIGSGSYYDGTIITLTAIPNEGYQFKEWIENNNSISIENPYTFTVSANRTIRPVFEIIKYTITTSATSGTVSGGGSYYNNDTVTLTAIPNEGYKFVRWTENETEVSTANPYTFTVSANKTIIAEFEELELNTTNLEYKHINIYPNPASNIFTINTIIGVNLSIIDCTGKIVYKTTINSELTSIETSTFNNGIYFVNVNDKILKLIINK